MMGKKNIIWFISFFLGCITVVVCLLIHLDPNSSEVTHLGLNAQITDIDIDNHILYVKDINKKDFIFGDRCAIDCTKAMEHYNLFYVNYNATNDVRNIDFSDFEVGDAIIIALSDREKQNIWKNVAMAEQVQLSTQRMNTQE